jgi:rhodanese-related sulfurtransferase
MKMQASVMIVGFAVSLFTAGAPAAAEAAAVVDGATAKALAASGAKVVDVRTPEEFASGHVPGAINIPYDQLPRRAAEIGPTSTKVVLYCRTGRRSGMAADALQKAGFSNLYDFKSVTAWPGELAK